MGENLSLTMNKLAAVLALGTAGAESFVQGGTLSLNWKDCGDASTKGKVSGLTPTSLTLGKKTRVSGAGSVTEDVSAGKIAISMKASIISKTYSGDVCKAQTFTLPLGVGSITYDGVKCPLAAEPPLMWRSLVRSSLLRMVAGSWQSEAHLRQHHLGELSSLCSMRNA